MISIVYSSSRWDSKIEWFLDALFLQTTPKDREELEIIFVDRHLWDDGVEMVTDSLVDVTSKWMYPKRRREFIDKNAGRFNCVHLPPKPCSWQGPWRLTKEEWFAASNSRNTGIAVAKHNFLAFADDLSLPKERWFASVLRACEVGLVTCGAYQKVKKMEVENGTLKSHEYFAGGVDNRIGNTNGNLTNCTGNWLYGCSFVSPLQALLDVNGFDENCDGMGFEDCILGFRMENHGYRFRYDPDLFTYESEELHHLDKAMRREDKGLSPKDKSHAMLDEARVTKRAVNHHLGAGGILEIRERYKKEQRLVLPIYPGPIKDWYDQQPIGEM
jgi:GT2 family glycosyltransferase